MSWILSSGVIAIASYVLHNYAGLALEGENAKFAQAIAYGFTSIFLRNAYESTHSAVLFLHVLLAYIAYHKLKWRSAVINRVLYFPLITSSLALWCAPRIPFTPSPLSVGAVVLLQLWSLLRSLLMLAVYPATALSDVEPQCVRDGYVENFLRSGRAKRLCIPSTRGVQLDALVLHPLGAATERWIVYLGGNAELMENSCMEMSSMADMLCAHWVFYNARGLGHSTGYITHTRDLVDDAAAVVHFVMRQNNIPASRVMLWGHSIGGGIAAAVARQHTETLSTASLVLDRTFSRLSDAAAQFSPLSKSATRELLRAAVGEMDTARDCAAVGNKRIVLFHAGDEVIGYTAASLVHAVACGETHMDLSCIVELKDGHVTSPHNSLLSSFYEYRDITCKSKSNRLRIEQRIAEGAMTMMQSLSTPQEMSAELDDTFREIVTQTLQKILEAPPADPVRVLSESLRMGSTDYVNERHTCVLPHGAHVVTLTRACLSQRGAEFREVPGLPLAALINPNVYEIQAAVRRLDNARVVIILEPAVPPTDLIFRHGVPYVADVTAQLLCRRRRCQSVDPRLDNAIGNEKKIADILTEVLGNAGVSTLREAMDHAIAGMEESVQIVELPRVRSDVLGVFDKMNAVLSRFSETPAVILVSYAATSAATTFARVIGAVLPIHEATQRRRLAKARSVGESRISQLRYSVLVDYWRDVLRRRDDRDNIRSSRRQSASSIRKKRTREAQAQRARRREQEDVAFLRAALLLRGAAATRIQAAWRGYRWRRALRRAVGVIRGRCVLSHTARRELWTEWASNTAVGTPPILVSVVDRLSRLHGELFGHYELSPPPVPQYVSVVRPVRTKVPSVKDDELDEIESEAEDFVVERVVLPSSRQMNAVPHMNPLRRLMECERIAGSDAAEEALTVLRECCGLSVLQRRAYESLKGLVLSLLHIAYLELYHRKMLPIFSNTFSSYVYRFHAEVLAWLSAPHMFSCNAARSLTESPILSVRETILTERVLVSSQNPSGGFYVAPCCTQGVVDLDNEGKPEGNEEKGDEDNKMREETNEDGAIQDDDNVFSENGSIPTPLEPNFDVRESVRVVPSFLCVSSWELAIRELINSNVLCVSWWSLHPHPAAYLGNDPYILEPRGEQQLVEGRAPYDEFAHFTVTRKLKMSPAGTSRASAGTSRASAGTTCSVPLTLSIPGCSSAMNSPRVVRNIASPLITSSRSTSHRASYVADGLMVHLSKDYDEIPVPSRLVSYEVTIPDPRTGEVPLAAFLDAALTAEDALLASEMNKDTQLPRYVRRAPFSAPFGVSTTAPHATFTVEMPPLALFTSSGNAQTDCGSRVEVRSGLRSSGITASHRSYPLLRSGQQRPESRLQGGGVFGPAAPATGTGEAVVDLNASRSLNSVGLQFSQHSLDPSAVPYVSSSRGDPHYQSVLFTHPSARAVDDVAIDLASRVGYEGGAFMHERPWLTHVCGRAFLVVFEKFITRIIDRLRRKYMLIMALDDPLQLIYFHAACLLKLAARQAVETEAQRRSQSRETQEGCRSSCSDADEYARRRRVALLSPEANMCLASIDEFLVHLAEATSIGASGVEDAFYTVLSVIQANSPGGLAFLENIVGMVRAAEEEVNRRNIEDIILAIVCRVEQLCWLILLQVFIASSVSSNVFRADITENPASFTIFVDCLGVIPLIDRLDPWVAAPERSPDPFHLRYSNGLRRWDDRSYIYKGAFSTESASK